MPRLVDLTHWLEPNMPVYPGTEPPRLEAANTVARDGFAEKKLTFYSHTGTHLDAPAHMLPGGRTLDGYPISTFYGRAVLADVRALAGDRIGLMHLAPLADRLKTADFLILRTGWAERWGSPDYFNGFPALTAEAARWLLQFNLKGLGTDAISIDRMDDGDFPVHHLFFAAGLVAIENLTNLDGLGSEFTLGCFPLFIKDADGAPIRAVAFLD